MSNSLIRIARNAVPAPLTIASGRAHTAETIMRAWLEGKSANTIRSYETDLGTFAVFLSRALGISPPLKTNDALARLFKQSSPSAHEVLLAFRNHLSTAGLAASTINRHLAALRSVSKLARMLGLITWYLELPGLKPEKRRSTAGPSIGDVRAMLDATSGDTEAETRDYAIVTTLYVLGLRVSELCGLNLHETDLERGSTWIRGKGRRERELVPLPAVVVDALKRYLRWRGMQAGPLFLALSKGAKSQSHSRARDGRLETRSVLRIVRLLGQRVGLHIWCHALRHSSITTAAELGQRNGLGLEQILTHSRHRNIGTLLLYVDQRDKQRTQRTLADLVATTLSRARD